MLKMLEIFSNVQPQLQPHLSQAILAPSRIAGRYTNAG